MSFAVGLALGLAGCGGSSTLPDAGAGSTSPTTPSSSSSESATVASTGSTTTTAVVKPGTGKPVVTIGDKNYAEQFVLGQLYLQALEAQGFQVNLTDNIGPPTVVRQALKNGTLALYPEYLDTVDETLAHLRRHFPTLDAAEAAGETWAARHGLELLAPTPFSDTSALAVTDAYASAHHLSSLGDLTRVARTLTIGGAIQFKTDRVGLRALRAVYGITPAGFAPLAVGDQYKELDADTVQAAYVNTTDGELASGDYRILRDPQRIFGFGNIVPVVSSSVLAQEGPAFSATVERVDRTLTLQTMRELDDAAAGQSPATVALQYLETHGLLGPLLPSDY